MLETGKAIEESLKSCTGLGGGGQLSTTRGVEEIGMGGQRRGERQSTMAYGCIGD